MRCAYCDNPAVKELEVEPGRYVKRPHPMRPGETVLHFTKKQIVVGLCDKHLDLQLGQWKDKRRVRAKSEQLSFLAEEKAGPESAITAG